MYRKAFVIEWQRGKSCLGHLETVRITLRQILRGQLVVSYGSATSGDEPLVLPPRCEPVLPTLQLHTSYHIG